jgi:Xaa-Pro aminopeptidase
VLHYTANASPLAAGSLVLLDAGARHRFYCGDISRTLPVSGRFTDVQRRLYELVLAAHAAAIAAVRPGASFAAVHDAAVEVLRQGLEAEGLLRADADGMPGGSATTLARFFPHRTSHWLGLDVHDVGDYVRGGEPRRLEPGMVLTVEPGLYVGDGAAFPHGLRGTGIRIEDDVLVTPNGAEVLTAALPTAASEIEALLG